jgi:hypothetical protein
MASTGAAWVSIVVQTLPMIFMIFSGFKGKETTNVKNISQISFSLDPYSREDQANFAKWYVGRLRLMTSFAESSASAMRCAQVITPLMHFPCLKLNYQGPEHTVEVGGSTPCLHAALCQCSTRLWMLQVRPPLALDTCRTTVISSNAGIL